MTLEAHVRKSILTYPSLYKAENYEKSRLAVLNQIFLVIGNGYDWAHTKNPLKGGYLTDSATYYKRGEKEGERKFDKPYGTEDYPQQMSENYFSNRVFEIDVPYGNYKAKIKEITIREDEWNGKKRLIIEVEGLDKIKEGDEEGDYQKLLRKIGRSKDQLDVREVGRTNLNDEFYDFKPYPICEYSAIKELYDGDLFIQPDWLQGAIDVAEAALEYYNDENRYKTDIYYPSEGQIKSAEKRFEEKLKEGGQKAVDELRKIWGYKEGQTVKERKWESWNKFHSESLDFINKFLERYKK